MQGSDNGLVPTGLVVGLFSLSNRSLRPGVCPGRESLDRVKSIAADRRAANPFGGLTADDSVRARPPGGRTVELTFRGTSDYEWSEDPEGFTAVRGRYAYAVYDRDWNLSPTEPTVGQFDPEKSGLVRDPGVP